MCRSAVNDGSCSPWVMCSCSVVSGNQIRDNYIAIFTNKCNWIYIVYLSSPLSHYCDHQDVY